MRIYSLWSRQCFLWFCWSKINVYWFFMISIIFSMNLVMWNQCVFIFYDLDNVFCEFVDVKSMRIYSLYSRQCFLWICWSKINAYSFLILFSIILLISIHEVINVWDLLVVCHQRFNWDVDIICRYRHTIVISLWIAYLLFRFSTNSDKWTGEAKKWWFSSDQFLYLIGKLIIGDLVREPCPQQNMRQHCATESKFIMCLYCKFVSIANENIFQFLSLGLVPWTL